MRAVADTNVYISALNFGGTAEEVLTLGRAQAIQLFVSPSILKEVEGVLTRKFHWPAKRARQALADIQEFARLVHPKETIHVVTEDESDNRILECALEADAAIVITGDKHLRQLSTFRGISVMSPGKFLESHLTPGQHS